MELFFQWGYFLVINPIKRFFYNLILADQEYTKLLVERGQALAKRHKGWEFDLGGCVCKSHIEWEKLMLARGEKK